LIGTRKKDEVIHMNTIKTKDGIEIFYKDWGKGQAIVFSHGWPAHVSHDRASARYHSRMIPVQITRDKINTLGTQII